ncbi:MAG: fasciclin domain-containing protein, partial [Bacteroides sp.]|nr:fasciclin domain-containing protein [Bacteroides sp.]
MKLKIYSNFKFKLRIVFLFVAVVAINSCKEDPQLWKVDSEEQVIGDYIASNPEYSEFNKLIELAGMKALLRIRGPFTVFLPTNEAMMDYYAMKGVSGLEEFSDDVQEDICRNHFVDAFIGTGDIGLGALREVNGLGDYLSSEFDGSDILISKTSKIIQRDIYCSNGVVQIMDKVMD